jgi:hypothetical protein
VGGVLVVHLVVSLVALDAALLEVLVRLDELFVDEERQVVGLRLDRRSCTCSPLCLAHGLDEGLAGLLEHSLVGVTGHAAAGVIGGARRGHEKAPGQESNDDRDDEPCLHASSRKRFVPVSM